MARKLFRVWSPRNFRNELALIVKVLNDERSWFGHPDLHQLAMPTDDKSKADWIVDFATDDQLQTLNFGGLSVTMMQKDVSGRQTQTPETQFNWNNWTRVPSLSNQDTLSNYRIQVINHEFGHVLGEGHRVCQPDKNDNLAPIMLQQTKGLKGCTQNPWPLPFEIEHAAQKGLQ